MPTFAANWLIPRLARFQSHTMGDQIARRFEHHFSAQPFSAQPFSAQPFIVGDYRRWPSCR
jgi:hypothetical protein